MLILLIQKYFDVEWDAELLINGTSHNAIEHLLLVGAGVFAVACDEERRVAAIAAGILPHLTSKRHSPITGVVVINDTNLAVRELFADESIVIEVARNAERQFDDLLHVAEHIENAGSRFVVKFVVHKENVGRFVLRRSGLLYIHYRPQIFHEDNRRGLVAIYSVFHDVAADVVDERHDAARRLVRIPQKHLEIGAAQRFGNAVLHARRRVVAGSVGRTDVGGAKYVDAAICAVNLAIGVVIQQSLPVNDVYACLDEYVFQILPYFRHFVGNIGEKYRKFFIVKIDVHIQFAKIANFMLQVINYAIFFR